MTQPYSPLALVSSTAKTGAGLALAPFVVRLDGAGPSLGLGSFWMRTSGNYLGVALGIAAALAALMVVQDARATPDRKGARIGIALGIAAVGAFQVLRGTGVL